LAPEKTDNGNMTSKSFLFKTLMVLSFGFILLLCTLVNVNAQPGDRQQRPGMQRGRGFGGGPGGFGPLGGRGPRRTEEIAARFDSNGDGKLNDEERRAARIYIQESRGEKGDPRPSGSTSPENTNLQTDVISSKIIRPKEQADLYNEKILRTLYLRFPNADWYEELGDFYRTDVDVPADLVVDGKVYRSVGVRFRGSSSYFMLGHSEKKSLNIAVDYGVENQRLYGYKTLDLLNSHADPSFIRTILFSRIARQYIPAPKANFVKLVINGESWGIYINVQQFNKDFLREWFGTTEGIRWKVPPNRAGTAALTYLGSDPVQYEDSYQLKTKGGLSSKGSKVENEAWRDLIKLCEIFDKTPDEQLETELSALFDVDGALWYLALENVFIDNDGYFSRGSDYALYKDPHGRFHMIPHDSNETFRYVSGGGPNNWDSYEPMLSPVAQENTDSLPVIKRLLAIPHLRARYLAHIRTIVKEWLDWEILGPMINDYITLIDEEVKADDKKLYDYDAFASNRGQVEEANDSGGGGWGFGPRSSPSLKRFITERREFLLEHPEINKPTPTIHSVALQSKPTENKAVPVTAKLDTGAEVNRVLVYYTPSLALPFKSVSMFDDGAHHDGMAGDGIYGGDIPPFPAGVQVHYYVEARSVPSVGTTTFKPERTTLSALTYQVTSPSGWRSPVIINEFMASNTKSLSDPQKEFDDWIELHNLSDHQIDLSGMYLSDRKERPKKWTIPEHTFIPAGGYLILWADEDVEDEPGLHLNFKLSNGGEFIILTDRDERGNRVLDSTEIYFLGPTKGDDSGLARALLCPRSHI
jgi:hypothetical protein